MIKTNFLVRSNILTKEKIASARIVDLQVMDFAEFCDYLAQDSTVGSADVAAVMTQIEKKLPLLLSMGIKVQMSQEGMVVKPTVSGSLTQAQLKAKLQARKDAGDDKVDVNREITATDLTVNDLTAGVSVDFSKKFKTSFAQNTKFKRVNGGTAEPEAPGDTDNAGASTPSQKPDSSSGSEDEC